ncbi:MAG: glycosyltransferase [Candidatus Izemoplasmatales bacterium]
MSRKRILVVSDSPTLYSGLGRWCREVSARLAPDHDVAVAGWHYQGQRHEYPFHIYPLEKQSCIFPSQQSINQLNSIIEDFQPDYILGLGDLDYFSDFPEMKRYFSKARAPEIILYLTVDGLPLFPGWAPIALCADKVFSCTEFGKKVLKSLDSRIDAEVLPLGYNPDVFGISGTRKQLREMNNFSDNKFVIIANQQNTPRHNLNALVWAYADFLKERPNAESYLYINTDPQDPAGPNLLVEAKRAGIEKKISFGFNRSVLKAVGDNEVNGLYNMAEVIVLASCNEGFGLPALEAMSAGTIPIVTNYSSLTELASKTGILVPPSGFMTTNFGIRQAIISHDGLVKALTIAYDEFANKRDDFNKRRLTCIEFARNFTWSKVTKRLNDYFIERLPTVSFGKTGNIGVMTSWNEQCGIAEHNKKYVDKLPNKTVFACSKRSPLNEEVQDEDYVVRCWTRDFNDYNTLLEAIKKKEIAILHIHHEFSFYENQVMFKSFLKELRKLGIKTILTMHTVLNINNLLAQFSGLVDKVTVCFNDEVDFLKEVDLEHVNNAIEWVDPRDKELVRNKLNITSKHVIVSSGFWQIHKGYYQVIQTMPELLKDFPDLLYIIVGGHAEGLPYMKKVNSLIEELNLKDHVLIIDKYVPREELYDWLSAGDVLVYNYDIKFQSSSAAVLTGLSSHRPVVTSDSPMFSMLRNEAIKIPTNDLGKLRRAIKELFEDTGYGDILVSRADRLLKNLTPEKIAEKYGVLYKELEPAYTFGIDSPEVLIGVPTYNNYERVDTLLTSIKENTEEGKYQLVCVDDGSSNMRMLAGLRRVCKKHNVPLVEHPVNKGIPSAWNTLTKFNEKSKYVVLFNDDIKVIDKSWLKNTIYFLENNTNIGMVGYPLIQIDKTTGKPNVQYALPDNSVDIGVVGAAVGCCFAFTREAYNKTLGFWEDLVSFYEEIDFGFQLKALGYESIMLPCPSMEHWGSQTFGSNQNLAVRDIDDRLVTKLEYLNVLQTYQKNLAIDMQYHVNLLNAGKAYRMDFARVLFSKRWMTQDKFINPQVEVHNRLFNGRKPRVFKWINKDGAVTEKEL